MTIHSQGRGAGPEQVLKHFTDREPHLDIFRSTLAASEGETLRVLEFHGVGGVGKTTLIERLSDELDESNPLIPHARFDVENLASPVLAYRDVLLSLRCDLEERFGLAFPRFDLAFAVMLAREGDKPPPLVRVSENLNDVFQFALALVSAPKDGVLNLIDRQLRKHKTAEHWVRRIGGTEEVIRLRERARRDDPTLAEELIDRFVDDLVAGLPPRPGKACRGVLFFDTFETLWKGSDTGRSVQARRLDAWLRRLAQKVRGRGVMVVVAGRDELRWAEDEADWKDAIEKHLLGGLSRHDAQIYLAKRVIGPSPWTPEAELQKAILDVCSNGVEPNGEVNCHPFFLALCADVVENFRSKNADVDPPVGTFAGLPSDQVARSLADRFLKSLPGERWEFWIKELSLTPSFDERAALELDRDRHHNLGRAGLKQLCRYSFVEAQPDGRFRLHKTMRDVLRTSVGGDAVEIHIWFRDHWTSRDEPALAFFHRWSLAPEATLNGWLEEHEAALKDLRIGTARLLLNEWSEIPLDGLDRRQIGDQLWARTHGELGGALEKTPIAPHASALNAAIAHFESAMQVYTEANFPSDWATAQNNMGTAYTELPTGDQGENLRRAIACFDSALRVCSETRAPFGWAWTQNNLGNAYIELQTGNTSENLNRAIACFESALRVYTEAASPSDWARAENNLGIVYCKLETGDQGENLRRAIACFDSALRVYTEAEFPTNWAMTQNNLGKAFCKLPNGDHCENFQRAIACFESALRVYTEAEFPKEWAGEQHNLGSAYIELTTGDRGENLRRAIAFLQSALRVHVEADFPYEWAKTQLNLGITFSALPTRNLEWARTDRGWRIVESQSENSDRAISCFESALRVYTEADFPMDWAMTQFNLGLALRVKGKFDESALAFECAARGYEGAGSQNNAERARIQGEESRRGNG